MKIYVFVNGQILKKIILPSDHTASSYLLLKSIGSVCLRKRGRKRERERERERESVGSEQAKVMINRTRTIKRQFIYDLAARRLAKQSVK